MNRIVYGALAALIMAGAQSRAQEAAWKPAESVLKTRWAAQVDPKTVHAEYPRPQMTRTKWVNLNGLWQYAVRPIQEEKPAMFDGSILVPFPIESALSGVKKAVKPQEKLWYSRSLELAKPTDGKRFLLHFGAVDWAASVYVNGVKVGEHKGGFDPFSFDVTDALAADKTSQELVVAVSDPTDAGNQARGKQVLEPKGIWYTAVTGIWQTVWLEPVPAKHVEFLKVVTDIDTGEVKVTSRVAGADAGTTVRAVATDGGTVIGEATGPAGSTLTIKTSGTRPWTPDDPRLYDLVVQVVGDGGDVVGSYFGMRKIALGKDEQGVVRLMLNGKPVFQYGPLDQGWWPDGLYTAPTDEAMKYDIEITKKLGFNMIRKHVKVEPARWYYYCDKMGMLVWQDMPSADNKDEPSRQQFAAELQRMMDALQTHPSIVMWVPFNEGWGQHDTPEVVEAVKKHDPTRLVNNASGWTDKGVGDVHDMHNYPGPGMPKTEPARAAVLGEFGGLGLPVENHLLLAKNNWGYRSYTDADGLGKAYLQLVDRLKPLIGIGLNAGVYTQTTDVENEINGFMTYDREVLKFPLEAVAKAHAELYKIGPATVTKLSPSAQDGPQVWKYATETPADSWTSADFDDSGWKTGQSGFGVKSAPGSIVNTDWNTADIYLRRVIDLPAAPTGRLFLSLHHDDDVQVYLNGKSVLKLPRATGDYEIVPLDDEAASALKPGRNVIAVQCHQRGGHQYIDLGLSELKPSTAAKP